MYLFHEKSDYEDYVLVICASPDPDDALALLREAVLSDGRQEPHWLKRFNWEYPPVYLGDCELPPCVMGSLWMAWDHRGQGQHARMVYTQGAWRPEGP